MIVRFVLLCEGSSDEPLVEHLQELLVSHGADEASGYSDSSKGTVADKLARILEMGAQVDVAFVHRDADSPDAEPRLREIANGVRRAAFTNPYVPVVPVQEIEAWLLIDESAIRSVVGNPNGRMPLDLPSPEHVEEVARPKEALLNALALASGKTGKRLAQEKQRFGARRRVLLQRLDTDGVVRRVRAWQKLEQAIRDLAHEQGWARPDSANPDSARE